MTPKPTLKDSWERGDLYEPYVGRWSRLVAEQFLEWLAVPPGKEWLDIGCGTGALTQAIFDHAGPSKVIGVDPSSGFLEYARARMSGKPATFQIGDARSLPVGDESTDAAVAGLCLNFVPEPSRAVSEMARVVRPGGVVGAYVWDYSGKMELTRYFWDAAVALDSAAGPLDQGRRFPGCDPDALRQLFARAGLAEVAARPIDIPTEFRDFAEFWSPFLGGQGSAPSYAMSLSAERRDALRDRIRSSLPVEEDGTIRLIARAWAVRGRKAG